MAAIARPDAFDARIVLRLYAWGVIELGLLCAGFGPFWTGLGPTDAWLPVVTRLSGCAMVASGCCAVGLSDGATRAARRRGLGWFALAHLVMAFGLGIVMRSGLVNRDAAAVAANVVLGVAVLLGYLWQTSEGDYHSAFHPFAPRSRRALSVIRTDTPTPVTGDVKAIAQQEERHRLARDLHDSVKQQVFVIQTAAATAEARFETDPGGARQAVQQVRASAREAAAELDAMLDQLRAVPLEMTGLVAAMQKQVEAFGFRTGAAVDVTFGDLPANDVVPPGTANAVFRITQEALANIARHARATRVTVSLEREGNDLRLRVDDNGVGFDPAQPNKGMGMSSMRTRAEELGGRMSVISPLDGTQVTVRLPLITETLQQLHSEARSGAWLGAIGVVIFGGDLVLSREFDTNVVLLVVSVVTLGRNLFVYARLRPTAGATS